MGIVCFGPFCLNRATRQLFRNGSELRLPLKTFDFLSILITARPRAVPKSELLNRLWPGVATSDSGLHRVAYEVRRALNDTARPGGWIRNIHGYGFAFVGNVAEDTNGIPTVVGITKACELGASAASHEICCPPDALVSVTVTVIPGTPPRVVLGSPQVTHRMGAPAGGDGAMPEVRPTGHIRISHRDQAFSLRVIPVRPRS
jgi:DNA-binding winged helix-turn-helix (wHTH) protein